VLSVVQASAASDTAMAEVAFITLVLSVLIDCWGIGGPRWAPIFDRLAFLGWIVVWAVGFAGTAAMASTGITRAGPAAPVRAGGGWLRKMFPGSVNFGMVALALLFVTGATVIEGGIASAMNAGVQRDIQFMVWATHPLLGQIGHIK
jgi:hypothetical protein